MGSFLAAGSGCVGQPAVPEQPTWADVRPILAAECTSCHGSTANQHGSGYRFDFFDMTPDVCGEAASALPGGVLLAGGWASSIATAITPPPSGGRERMPPLPGPSLEGWQRETLARWTRQPIKGAPPRNNRQAQLQVYGLPSTASTRLRFIAVVSDPDGDEAVGVIKVGDATFAMNRSGSFAADIDVSKFPAQSYRLTGVACDGWTSSSFDLGPVSIKR